MCRHPIERCWTKHNISNRLGQNSADAEHDTCTKLWVSYYPGDQLAIPLNHRCNQYRHWAIIWPSCCEQFGCCFVDGLSRAQLQTHQTTFSFVSNCVSAQFGDDRKSNLRSRLGRKFGSGHLALISHRNSGLAQESFRCRLGQGTRRRCRTNHASKVVATTPTSRLYDRPKGTCNNWRNDTAGSEPEPAVICVGLTGFEPATS